MFKKASPERRLFLKQNPTMLQADKNTEFLQAVINEHPEAIERLIRSYGKNIPASPKVLFALYVQNGEKFAKQLDSIDSEESEVENYEGANKNGGKASGVLKSAYDLLLGKKETTATTEAKNAEQTAEENKKSTYKIFGKNISKYLVWGISGTFALLITWVIIALVNKNRE